MSTLEYITTKYQLKNNPVVEIPNVGRLDLVRWIRELDFKTFAEIGVEHADFSKIIAQNNPQLKLYGVDPYLKYGDYHEYDTQKQMDGIHQYAIDKMGGYIKDGRYELIRKPSLEAVKDFEDESLDGVYIDGNHEGEFPYQDIVAWTKKVKKGGLVSGHDYVRIRALDFTIKDALEKYVKENNIEPLFILGSHEIKSGQIRDRVRSWAFVRQ